jgi:hypothetical protein
VLSIEISMTYPIQINGDKFLAGFLVTLPES